MYIRREVGSMPKKKKLTLSIRDDLVREVKKIALERGVSLSSIVEEYFEFLVSSNWIDKLAEELGIGELEPTKEDEIPAGRPKGVDSTSVIRDLRGNKWKRISNA